MFSAIELFWPSPGMMTHATISWRSFLFLGPPDP
jgi:hypothetical protein